MSPISICNMNTLVTLPTEMICCIIYFLLTIEDLDSLYHMALTCRRLYNIVTSHEEFQVLAPRNYMLRYIQRLNGTYAAHDGVHPVSFASFINMRPIFTSGIPRRISHGDYTVDLDTIQHLPAVSYYVNYVHRCTFCEYLEQGRLHRSFSSIEDIISYRIEDVAPHNEIERDNETERVNETERIELDIKPTNIQRNDRRRRNERMQIPRMQRRKNIRNHRINQPRR